MAENVFHRLPAFASFSGCSPACYITKVLLLRVLAAVLPYAGDSSYPAVPRAVGMNGLQQAAQSWSAQGKGVKRNPPTIFSPENKRRPSIFFFPCALFPVSFSLFPPLVPQQRPVVVSLFGSLLIPECGQTPTNVGAPCAPCRRRTHGSAPSSEYTRP